MKKLLKGFVILACVIFVFEAPAKAEIIKIGFIGKVNFIDDQYNLLEGAIPQNSSITGYFVYDSSTPNSDPWPEVCGAYIHTIAPYGMSVKISGLTFQTDPENVNFQIHVENNYSGKVDSYAVNSINNLPLANGLTVDSLLLGLADYTGTALSNTELPLVPPDLSKWQDKEFWVRGGKYPYQLDLKTLFSIRGHVDSVYLVPEPATLLLLGFGVLFLRKCH